jgi:hypothetical protein
VHLLKKPVVGLGTKKLVAEIEKKFFFETIHPITFDLRSDERNRAT